jgi:hypothetical protein
LNPVPPDYEAGTHDSLTRGYSAALEEELDVKYEDLRDASYSTLWNSEVSYFS